MRLVLCDEDRISCEALAVALGARGHQAPTITLTVDKSVATKAGYQPEARLMDHRFPDEGRALALPGRSGTITRTPQ